LNSASRVRSVHTVTSTAIDFVGNSSLIFGSCEAGKKSSLP
jgi:hypothetical protein